MVIFSMKMKALPEKFFELKQTLQALIEPTRKEKGCLSHYVFQDIENENNLCLFEMWQSQVDLDEHLRSDQFTVLVGTKILLSQAPEITISEVPNSSGWKAVEAVRNY
ncbi:MAG: putative quinol monooxygenase [Desulfobacterales bacterium]|jgi:quinol monooxygenase YgiN